MLYRQYYLSPIGRLCLVASDQALYGVWLEGQKHFQAGIKEEELVDTSNSIGSLSTVVGDEKLTSRENLIGFLFLYVQSDENTLPKVNKVSKTEAQTFDVFDKLIGPLQFCI